VAKAFDDITVGIGRASPLILDNLGIVVNLTEAYDAAAIAVGKTAEQLTQQEKSAALLANVLENNADRTRDFTAAQSEASLAIAKGQAAFKNFSDFLGDIFTRALFAVGAAITSTASGLLGFGVIANKVFISVAELFETISGGVLSFDRLQASAEGNIASLQSTRKELDANAASMKDYAFRTEEAAVVVPKLTEAVVAQADEIVKLDAAVVGSTSNLGLFVEQNRVLQETLRETQTQVALTSFQFDALAEAQGRAAAVAAALAGGGRLVLGGTRIRFTGGGSRLVSSPGFGSQFAGNVNLDGSPRRF
jgi:hypothetical protein